jgi:hypothetical protein
MDRDKKHNHDCSKSAEPNRHYYLFYFLNDPTVWIQKGGGQPFISLTDARNVKVPLPPLATQQHIARVLEQADQLRKQAQQMESELNQLAQRSGPTPRADTRAIVTRGAPHAARAMRRMPRLSGPQRGEGTRG